MQRRPLNHRPSPPDPRDHRVRMGRTRAVLPTSADLSVSCTPVKDQGQIGACTAFSACGAMELMMSKYGGETTNFSERFEYYTTRVNVMGWPASEDSGAYVRDSLAALNTYGVCLEATFPYDGVDYSTTPPDAAYTEALKYRAIQYVRFDDTASADVLTQIKTSLANGFPVLCGFVCYENLWDAVGGVIPEPSGAVIGGHAVTLVGFSDEKQQLKFRNSWGSSWGDGHGYGFLSYAYYLSGNIGDLWTLFTTQDDARQIGLDVVVPTPTPPPAPPAPDPGLVALTAELLADISENLDAYVNRDTAIARFAALQTRAAAYPRLAAILNVLRSYILNMA